jgi:hypothetical protein
LVAIEWITVGAAMVVGVFAWYVVVSYAHVVNEPHVGEVMLEATTYLTKPASAATT